MTANRRAGLILTRFLSPDCKSVSEYGQICRRCYDGWNCKDKRLEDEDAAPREQLAGKSNLIRQQAREMERRDEIIRRQEKELARVTAERDAAVADLKRCDADCNYCLHAGEYECCDLDCEHCGLDCECAKCRDNHYWKWRRAKEDGGNDGK